MAGAQGEQTTAGAWLGTGAGGGAGTVPCVVGVRKKTQTRDAATDANTVEGPGGASIARPRI